MANTHSIDLEGSSSQYLSAADHAALSITGDLTLECWYKPESAPGTDVLQVLISKYNGTGNQRAYQFGYQDVSGTKKVYFVASDDGTGGGGHIGIVAVNQTLTAGTWYHVAVVFTAASHSAEFFVNGASIGSGDTTVSALFDSTAAFQVGQNADGQADGLIDDVRVWAAARSGAQILANMSTELVGNETNLAGYWKLNNALTDSTSNGNTLTNNNSATFSTDVPFVGDSGGGGFFFIST